MHACILDGRTDGKIDRDDTFIVFYMTVVNIIIIFTLTFLRWCTVSTVVFMNNHNGLNKNMKTKLYRINIL